MAELISFAAQLRNLTAERPDAPAVTCGTSTLSRSELDRRSNLLAVELRRLGVGVGDMVTIALPNSADWFIASVALWKLGATPQPVSARLPRRELEAVVSLADPVVVIGVDSDVLPDRFCLPVGYQPPDHDGPIELADVVSPAWKAPTSGGSTGRPKLIVSGDPGLVDPSADAALLFSRDGCLVMPGPLFHNGPIVWACYALLHGNHVVVLPRFDAEATLEAMAEHRSDVVYLVPTMMKRIWTLPSEVRTSYDLSALRVVWHLAEPCPPWLKEAWIDWLGPERIYELYAGTEAQLRTVITGTEWLEHRGSVGRPSGGDVQICDPDGYVLPARHEGEVWLRSSRTTPAYRYIGAEARVRPGGWESLGDMGWLDDDGYLYLGDRAQDMILVGGSNVYPAEIESALNEHPAVRSCAVIGLPDEDRGNRVHAIVEADPATVTFDELMAFTADRLVAYKRPRTMEFVDSPLRDDAGKMRRSELRRARLDEPRRPTPGADDR
ncbi:MAG TPA: AMP-binding protein [Acidimicrobiales bacterium]|nr:AMP-binding protein [Acidimicrobiales bacterium]